MTLEAIIEALKLPRAARTDRRVPKKLLVEHGAPTAADKRQIESGIEELLWVAALKPNAVGLAAYRDDTREAVELAVLTLRLRPGAKAPRLVELVHRAIPYHLLLATEIGPGRLTVSLADKRWAQNEAGRVVLDGDVVRADLAEMTPDVLKGLCTGLSLTAAPRSDLYALYRGWIDAVHAAQAAGITGSFTPAQSDAQATDRREALRACAEIEARIAALRAAAAKEKQLARQVEMNLQVQSLRSDLAAAKAKL